MHAVNFDEAIDQIVKRDPRYRHDAYLFLREALDHTHKLGGRLKKDEIRHVSGRELLAGIRDYALRQFGPMALTVLEEWGVKCCEDFGEIVFNMVEIGLLAKTERDSRDDFKGGYLFDEAFREPFLPRPKRRGPAPPAEVRQV
jgi:uncharacterized repeat protein (TIGR04138 family)